MPDFRTNTNRRRRLADAFHARCDEARQAEIWWASNLGYALAAAGREAWIVQIVSLNRT